MLVHEAGPIDPVSWVGRGRAAHNLRSWRRESSSESSEVRGERVRCNERCACKGTLKRGQYRLCRGREVGICAGFAILVTSKKGMCCKTGDNRSLGTEESSGQFVGECTTSGPPEKLLESPPFATAGKSGARLMGRVYGGGKGGPLTSAPSRH